LDEVDGLFKLINIFFLKYERVPLYDIDLAQYEKHCGFPALAPQTHAVLDRFHPSVLPDKQAAV
jgi:hypothetical protein